MKPKQRQRQPAAKPTIQFRTATTTLGLVLVVAVVTFTLLASTCYQQYTVTGPYAREYEGKILDKSQTITESSRGSGVRRRLFIEGRAAKNLRSLSVKNTTSGRGKGCGLRRPKRASS